MLADDIRVHALRVNPIMVAEEHPQPGCVQNCADPTTRLGLNAKSFRA